MSEHSAAGPSTSIVAGSVVDPSTTGSQSSLLEMKHDTFDNIWDSMITLLVGPELSTCWATILTNGTQSDKSGSMLAKATTICDQDRSKNLLSVLEDEYDYPKYMHECPDTIQVLGAITFMVDRLNFASQVPMSPYFVVDLARELCSQQTGEREKKYSEQLEQLHRLPASLWERTPKIVEVISSAVPHAIRAGAVATLKNLIEGEMSSFEIGRWETSNLAEFCTHEGRVSKWVQLKNTDDRTEFLLELVEAFGKYWESLLPEGSAYDDSADVTLTDEDKNLLKRIHKDRIMTDGKGKGKGVAFQS